MLAAQLLNSSLIGSHSILEVAPACKVLGSFLLHDLDLSLNLLSFGLQLIHPRHLHSVLRTEAKNVSSLQEGLAVTA